jgi:1-acyl-sn-glycerol-3-phosphate acyltransferase
VVFISLYPNATCIVKKALLKNFFIRGVIQGAGYIPNDENENMLNLCRDALNNGRTLIIFPEGTRTEPGKPINIKRGASQIAVRLGIPVRVAQIQVSGSMLTKSHSWYQLTPKLSEFNLVIGEKIEAGNSVYTSMPPSLAARHMTRRINEVLVKASSLDTNICLGYKSDNG